MGKDYSLAMEYPLGQRLRELPGPLLLTGHTGFKGTWMTYLLEHLNVPLVGYALLAEKDSLYDRAERAGVVPEAFADIRDYEALEQFIDQYKPSTIIHMAAQPLVLKSYESPRETFDVNVMGTVNLLDIAFRKDFVEAIIVVTTDKVYRNDNSGRSFAETDPLEGKDPYSASKVGTEAVVAAWQQIAKVSGGPKVVSVRAGNVIGGGDFAENRLIPDLIRSRLNSKALDIRNSENIRPWQHVLEPLSGYLMALEYLLSGRTFESINLGPNGANLTVKEVIEKSIRILEYSAGVETNFQEDNPDVERETLTLSLDSQLALKILGFQSMWNQDLAISKTIEWWNKVLSGNVHPGIATVSDIRDYLESLGVGQDNGN
jgi:CDP-glucose 4,6-dehydratase